MGLLFWEKFRPFRPGKGRVLRASGSYVFIKLLGRGGMSDVWLAEKLGLAGFSKLMAIKLVRRHRLRDPRTRQMLLDEARLVANLIHPNIVQVYQLARTWRHVFIVMEHVFGVTLLELLERYRTDGKRIPIDIGTFIVVRVCQGLHYAHRKHSRTGEHLQIVHRDICPTNVLITFRGNPKLSDFGVAKALSSTVDDEGNIVWGKLPYMAPEAVRRQGTDRRSDIYSLGLVMYEMFTGQLAHEVDSTRALTRMLEQETENDRDVRQVDPRFPTALAEIIARACEPDPELRYQDAGSLAEDLDRFLLSHFMFPNEERLSEELVRLFPRADDHRWW